MTKISLVIPIGPNYKLSSLDSIKKQGENVVLLVEEGTHPSKNRNNGIKKAKTEFIAFINSHTILSENWYQKVNNFFINHPQIDIVGGPQLNPVNDNFFAKLSGYALSSFFGSANMSYRYKPNIIDLNANETQITSANLICKKKVFKKVLFDENIYPGEDPKFITDAKAAGFKVAYSPDIIVFNQRRNNALDLIKQIFKYGFYRPKQHGLCSLLKKPVFFAPSCFVLYIILCLLGSLFGFYWLFLPLILYLIFAIIFGFYESIKHRSFFAVFLLPFAFLTILIQSRKERKVAYYVNNG